MVFRGIFFAFALFTVLFLVSVTRSLLQRRKRAAGRSVRVYALIASLYGVFLVTTTLSLPLQIIPITDPQFAGDWSIGVDSIRRTPHDLDEDYELDFRMGNRGTKVLHGDSSLIVYLLSENGTRYDPWPKPNKPGFDVDVKPGKHVTTTRRFSLPSNQGRLQLMIKREGFQWTWFVIGRTPFDGHAVVTIQ